MRRALRMLLIAALLPLLGPIGAASGTETGQAEATGETRALLDSIREDLVKLRFEQVLAATEALLGRPGLSAGVRGEALVLRSQAHVAFGDLEEADKDFREILRLQPGYRPEPSLTPAKAMKRFDAIRDKMIGTIRLQLDPSDATLWLDDEPVGPGPAGELPALVGRHTLRAERAGFDPRRLDVEVVAGAETAANVELVPNARTIVLRTEPDGVAVRLDGELVGVTARPESSLPGGATAELVVENVPLGEHLFELRKECFRVELLRDTLTVDLLDRTPKRYKPQTMVPARARITLRGGPPGALLAVDGKRIGALPREELELCPGHRELKVSLGERALWRESIELSDGVDRTLEVRPRPNVMLFGAADRPEALRSLGAEFNWVGAGALPADFDPEAESSWRALSLAVDTDLVVAVQSARRQGAVDRHSIYSPILRSAATLVDPPPASRPRWITTTWGFRAVDSRIGGPLRVVELRDGAPAAEAGLQVGARIVEVGGRPVGSVDELRATLGAASTARPLDLRWVVIDGSERGQAALVGRQGPLLTVGPTPAVEAMFRAAWALVDSVSDPSVAPTALASLALLLEEHGQYDLAAQSWRRVDWGDRAGVGPGTVRYYLGRVLERLGREAEAIEAYRRAAASESTTFDDDGPRVAPAAIDRMIDLGVSLDRPISAR